MGLPPTFVGPGAKNVDPTQPAEMTLHEDEVDDWLRYLSAVAVDTWRVLRVSINEDGSIKPAAIPTSSITQDMLNFGKLFTAVQTKTASYTLALPDGTTGLCGDRNNMFLTDATAGAVVYTLQPGASFKVGDVLGFEKISTDTNTITITPANAELIEGNATATVSGVLVIYWDGAMWRILIGSGTSGTPGSTGSGTIQYWAADSDAATGSWADVGDGVPMIDGATYLVEFSFLTGSGNALYARFYQGDTNTAGAINGKWQWNPNGSEPPSNTVDTYIAVPLLGQMTIGSAWLHSGTPQVFSGSGVFVASGTTPLAVQIKGGGHVKAGSWRKVTRLA